MVLAPALPVSGVSSAGGGVRPMVLAEAGAALHELSPSYHAAD